MVPALSASITSESEREGNMEFQVPGKGLENYQKLKTKLEHYKNEGKLGFVSQFDFEEPTCSVRASGMGFKARIECLDGLIKVDLELGLVMRAMRGQVEEQLQKMVKKIFGE